jgi:hypothetical protein
MFIVIGIVIIIIISAISKTLSPLSRHF